MQKLFRCVEHYSHAVEFRAQLLIEVWRARQAGSKLSFRFIARLLRQPSKVDEIVNVLRFFKTEEEFTIIDVGGNTGFWAAAFIDVFPKASVVAFEPVAQCYEEYTRRLGGHPQVTIYNHGISSVSRDAVMHIASASGNNTLMELGDLHKSLGIKFVGSEDVKLVALDDHYEEVADSRKILLKIDVQGHEVEVLRGAGRILPLCDVVVIECCFAEQYRNTAPSFSEVVRILSQHDLHPIILRDYGRQLGPIACERDVVFARRSLLVKTFGYGGT